MANSAPKSDVYSSMFSSCTDQEEICRLIKTEVLNHQRGSIVYKVRAEFDFQYATRLNFSRQYGLLPSELNRMCDMLLKHFHRGTIDPGRQSVHKYVRNHGVHQDEGEDEKPGHRNFVMQLDSHVLTDDLKHWNAQNQRGYNTNHEKSIDILFQYLNTPVEF